MTLKKPAPNFFSSSHTSSIDFLEVYIGHLDSLCQRLIIFLRNEFFWVDTQRIWTNYFLQEKVVCYNRSAYGFPTRGWGEGGVTRLFWHFFLLIFFLQILIQLFFSAFRRIGRDSSNNDLRVNEADLKLQIWRVENKTLQETKDLGLGCEEWLSVLTLEW